MNRFKQGFMRLPRHKKIVFVAAVVTILSCILPWYQDLSVYGVGDMYLGVTGPLFLAGFTILGLSLFLALMIGMPMMGKRFPKLPIKQSLASMLIGVESLFLILMANSVFYHSKFGVSISHKEPGFGMTVALIAVIGMIIGSYFWWKEESEFKGFDENVGRKEPLIRMKEEEIPEKKAPLKGFGYQQTRPGHDIREVVKETADSNLRPSGADQQPEDKTIEEAEKEAGTREKGKLENMKIRMDL